MILQFQNVGIDLAFTYRLKNVHHAVAQVRPRLVLLLVKVELG